MANSLIEQQKPIDNGSIIIGIDPGTRVSGYGVIRFQNQICTPLDYGCICPPAKYKLSERYLIIYNGIEELIEKYRPTEVVVETQYVKKNIQSALKLGIVRGVVIIAAKKRGLAVFQYTPTVAKRAVVGFGNASKFQVQGMIQRRLNLASLPEPEDAADALALAICHAQTAAHLKLKNEV